MRPLAIVGTSLLFAGCLTEEEPVETVAEGEPCEDEYAMACATDPADHVGYVCFEGAWTANLDCRCVDGDVDCVVIGFTGVDRAGARPVAGRRVRRV